MYIPFERSFFERPTIEVAQDLLGTLLVRHHEHGSTLGLIVETEAYGYADDPASHAYRGYTERTVPMFGIVGCAYVYLIYGNHYCFNIVARDPQAQAGAVLIRAVQPLEGISLMEMRRGKRGHELSNGPGKLAQAFDITKKENGDDLINNPQLYIARQEMGQSFRIGKSSRIGISVGTTMPWRFFIRENPCVSKGKVTLYT